MCRVGVPYLSFAGTSGGFLEVNLSIV
jgi:hypothetical protein